MMKKYPKESWLITWGMLIVLVMALLIVAVINFNLLWGVAVGLLIGAMLGWRAKHIEQLGPEGLEIMGRADRALSDIKATSTSIVFEEDNAANDTLYKAKTLREAIFKAAVNTRRESRGEKYSKGDINERWNQLRQQVRELEILAQSLESLRNERKIYASARRMPDQTEIQALQAGNDAKVLAAIHQEEVMRKKQETEQLQKASTQKHKPLVEETVNEPPENAGVERSRQDDDTLVIDKPETPAETFPKQ